MLYCTLTITKLGLDLDIGSVFLAFTIAFGNICCRFILDMRPSLKALNFGCIRNRLCLVILLFVVFFQFSETCLHSSGNLHLR